MRSVALLLTLLLSPASLFAQADVSKHLTLGNPSKAKADVDERNNYLLVNEEFAASYNVSTGGPNWVSWRLSIEDIGVARRDGLDFTVDPDLPEAFPKITAAIYAGSGFDKGHGKPFADATRNRAAGKRTFSTANCMPQAPALNRGLWSSIEGLRRDEAENQRFEVFCIVGPAGTGGRGEHGYRLSLGSGDRRVNVPALCWAAWIAIPDRRGNALKRITRDSEVRAVIFRNDQAQVDTWKEALCTVRDIELLTDLDLFDLLPDDVEHSLETRKP